MSYCRWIEADVYIYPDIQYGLYCCGCPRDPNGVGFIAGNDYDAMLAHIAEHREAGDFIPDYVDESLLEDQAAGWLPIKPVGEEEPEPLSVDPLADEAELSERDRSVALESYALGIERSIEAVADVKDSCTGNQQVFLAIESALYELLEEIGK